MLLPSQILVDKWDFIVNLMQVWELSELSHCYIHKFVHCVIPARTWFQGWQPQTQPFRFNFQPSLWAWGSASSSTSLSSTLYLLTRGFRKSQFNITHSLGCQYCERREHWEHHDQWEHNIFYILAWEIYMFPNTSSIKIIIKTYTKWAF